MLGAKSAFSIEMRHSIQAAAVVLAPFCVGCSDYEPPYLGWQLLPQTLFATFADVEFATEKVGWAHGFSACEHEKKSCRTFVFRTVDGVSWDWTDELEIEIDALAVTNSQTAWVVGRTWSEGTIMTTTDGGASWSTQATFDSTLHAVHFVDAQTGWLAGRNGLIARTDDGGTTWTEQSSGTKGQIRALAFIDDTNGWAVGCAGHNDQCESSGGFILATKNGGATWAMQSSDLADLRRVFFTSASAGWAAGSDLWTTTDGGATWTAQPVGTVEDRDGYQSTVASFRDIHMADEQVGWAAVLAKDAAETDGLVLKTHDGGQSWQSTINHRYMQFTPDIVGRPIYGIDFIDRNTGWAVGMEGLVLKTTTGGE